MGRRQQEMKHTAARLSSIAAGALVILTGCAWPRNSATPSPSPANSAEAIIVFESPAPARLAELQRAVSDGKQPWRHDSFDVAKAELAALVRNPPARVSDRVREALAALSPGDVEKVTDYRIYHDPNARTHVVFKAGPYIVDALTDAVRPDAELSPIWITRTVIFRRATVKQ